MAKALAYICLYHDDPTDFAEVQKTFCQKIFMEELSERGFSHVDCFFDRFNSQRIPPFVAREGGFHLLSSVQRGDVVLVPVFFRAWTQMQDFVSVVSRLHDAGAFLHVVNFSAPPDVYLRSAFLSTLKHIGSLFLASLEDAIRKSNIRALKKQLALKVKPSFGFKRVGSVDKGKIVRDEAVRTIAGIIVNLVDSGLTWEQVAQKLTESGIVNERSKNKAPFTPAGVRIWYSKELELRHREKYIKSIRRHSC